MKRNIFEQTDELEKVITELNLLNELVYKGYSIDSFSCFVDETNIKQVNTSMEKLLSENRNIRLYLVIN